MFHLTLFSGLSRSVWVELWHSTCQTLPHLVSPLYLLRMCLVSSSRLSMKVLNNIGLIIDPSCALLFTSHQLNGKPLITHFQTHSSSFLSSNTVQPFFFSTLIFWILERNIFKIPVERGSEVQRSFEEKLWGKQSLRTYLSTADKKSKKWAHLFFQRACKHTIYYFFIDTKDIF